MIVTSNVKEGGCPRIVYNIYEDVDIHIYILRSSARFARAEAYRIILWDFIMGLYYGMIFRDDITG